MIGNPEGRRWAALPIVVCLAAIAVQPALAADKIKVESLDDLPRFVYPIEGTASELLVSDQFPAFAARVRKDVEHVLAAYEIDDPSTLQGLYGVMQRLEFQAGNFDASLEWLENSRALEDKEANRLTSGLVDRAWVAARREAPGEGFNAAFAKNLEALASTLPWAVVQDNIQQAKGRAEIISSNLLIGRVQSEIDPVVASTGTLTEDMARTLIAMRSTIEMFLPVREEVAAVYQKLIDANRVEKPDIWAARAVTLTPEMKAQPVAIGIWDSGVDASVFSGLLWVNPKESLDGADNDGNGFIDDVNGIGFDLDGFRTAELLHPEGDMAGKAGVAMGYMKGFMDLNASIDSPEASALKKHIASLAPDQVKSFVESLQFATLYMHGTHVAGIAVEGNPYARILINRYTFDYHIPRAILTVEIAERHAMSFQESVDYFKKAGVRAVNMSWGWSLKEVEGVLESNGVTDPEERAVKTRAIFGILKKGLYDALASAPEILFITAAGNDDNDVEFDEVIPSNFQLPNLITVAAVDQAGDPTSFTSTGRNVVIYANGYEVSSYVPGGARMKASGASMASPNALNLAAKLLALDPSLTPARLIELMKAGATPRDGDASFLLINPQRSVELLRKVAATT
ncbi:MAG: apr [Acidobacteria bacterium]|nr:apr [Acidobacteriota bacterium]